MSRFSISPVYAFVVVIATFAMLSGCDSMGSLDDTEAPVASLLSANSSSAFNATSVSIGSAIPITADPADQQRPSIDADYIVWHDSRYGSRDVFLYEISTYTETQLTDSGQLRWAAAISGDFIVWQGGTDNDDIYLFEISTGEETLITTSTANQSAPAISGDYVVWQDDRNGNWDIYLYRISTGVEKRITDETTGAYNPAVSSDYIVWEDQRNDEADIYLYEISTGVETRITDETGGAHNPAISGDYVVWEDHDNFDIILYQISTGAKTQVTGGPAEGSNPAIAGDYVAWQRIDNNLYDIYLYQISTGAETLISYEGDEKVYQEFPAISGDYVVWQGFSNGNDDIYLYGIPGSVAPTTLVEKVESLREKLTELDLHEGMENSLDSKLRAALNALQVERSDAAHGILGAFIHHVKSQRGKKISTADADALIAEATAILSAIG